MHICIVTEEYLLGGTATFLAELLGSWPEPDDEFTIVATRHSIRFRSFLEQRIGRSVQWLTAPTLDRGDLHLFVQRLRRFGRRPRETSSEDAELDQRVVSPRWNWLARIALLVVQYPFFLWNIVRLTRLFRRLKPDVLIINSGYPDRDVCRAGAVAGARSGNVKVVMILHGMATPPPIWRWLPEKFLDRYIDRHAELVSVSRVALARLREVRDFRQPGIVIPNGITPRMSSSLSREDILREFQLPPQSYLITIVATFDLRKGHQLLFESLAILRPRLHQIRVLVFGTGNEADTARLMQLIHQHQLEDTVILCGFRQNVTAYLGAVDLLVLPSLLDEGMPMAVIEAMALRAPIIASDVGGVRELIEERVTGRLLPPGDLAALTRAIEQLIEHPQTGREWAKRAYERYDAVHTGEAMARSYHRLFSEGFKSNDGSNDSATCDTATGT